jgi:hypothetical protein
VCLHRTDTGSNERSSDALRQVRHRSEPPELGHQVPRDGSLLDDTVAFDGPVIGTEKADGTNARIIVLPDGT